jgi:hypothetical protein
MGAVSRPHLNTAEIIAACQFTKEMYLQSSDGLARDSLVSQYQLSS